MQSLREAAKPGAKIETMGLDLASLASVSAFSAALADRLTVNAFDPGLMPGTGLAREYSAPMRWVWNVVMPKMLPLMRLLLTKNIHTTEASGAALARLVTDPGLATTNGKYFEGLHEIRSSVDSYDDTRAADLWRDSASLTDL